jgi:hypothetical protein
MHLCTCVSEEGWDGQAACSETPSLLSYILRYVSFTEVGSVCRVALREPMHLCTCVTEEGGRRGSCVLRNAISDVTLSLGARHSFFRKPPKDGGGLTIS